MAAGKAYLVLPTEANVVNVLFDGEATNIGNEALRMKNQRSAPTGKANEESRGGIYDLLGRPVSYRANSICPTSPKPIYIINGKKFAN